VLDVAVRKRLGAFALDVAFTAPARGVTALFGRSGSGKTSTVAAIAGLLRPDDGHVRLDGAIFFDRAAGIDVPVERRRVGYVFQDGRLFPHMSVAGNLTYGLRRAPHPERRIALDRVVALLGLERLLPRRPAGLSGGEKQRVALGRALLAQPRLLLMDEPLASLDAPRKAEILPYIERLRDELGLPIVYVSHAVEEVVRLADTLVLIDHGRAAAVGDVHDLMARLDLHPLTGRYEAGAVIDAVVADHDAAYALTGLAFQGGRLVTPRIDLPVGARLRVRVRARDVMVALKAPEAVSVQNILPGRVAEVRVEPGAYAEVRIEVGDGAVAVVARITRQSADRLGLRPGLPVHALIKSISLDRHSLGFSDRANGRDAGSPEEAQPGGLPP
jgi:molybdate transport system ATP-binding protein